MHSVNLSEKPALSLTELRQCKMVLTTSVHNKTRTINHINVILLQPFVLCKVDTIIVFVRTIRLRPNNPKHTMLKWYCVNVGAMK